jgi:hypothetical protein
MASNQRKNKSRVTIDEDIVQDMADKGMVLIDDIGRVRGVSDALRRMGWGRFR